MTDYEIVIPTIKDEILTLESIPEDVPVHVEREGSLNEARNRGISKVESPLVLLMDDDIAFERETLDMLVERSDPDTLLGIEDWDYGLVAGRVMVFHRSLWEDVGGFDERLGSHMADTDFSLKTKEAGYDIETLPRDTFYHEEHERSVTTWDRAWRLVYLCVKHPRNARLLLSETLL